jgi:hypothetical protein
MSTYPPSSDDLASVAAAAAATAAALLVPDTAYVELFPDLMNDAAVCANVAAAAAAAAVGAANNATSLVATTTTTFTPSVHSQTITTQSGKAFVVGSDLRLSSAANPTTNWADGIVTGYTGTSLTLSILAIGTVPLSASDWNIALSGGVGPTGSTGSTGPDGKAGFKYVFNTATSGDPASGKFRFNNATFASATVVAFSETDGNSNALTNLFDAIDNGTGTNKVLFLAEKSDGSAFFSFYATSARTDQGAYEEFSITPVSTSGSISNADTFYVLMIPLEKGDAGAAGTTGTTGTTGSAGGGISIPYTFSTTTTNSDPGNGTLRLDNATQSSAVAIRADLLDSNGATWTTVLDALDDSTNTIKGQVRLFKTSDPTKFLEGNVTAVDSSSGYRNITVAITASSSSTPFANADAITLTYTRAGDKGSDGAGAGDTVGPSSATDNALARFDTTTGKLLQNSTVSLGDSGPLAPVTTDTVSLGSTTLMWSDLFLASGGVVNWNNGDVTITHSSNQLAFAGASTSYSFDANIVPASSDGAALGTSSLMFSDAFFASGAVINFNNGDVSITHSTGALSFGTSVAVTFGTIELGAASDTTISRSAAGVIAVEGVVIPSISSTSTLTNKRNTFRRGTTASSATPSINTDNYDIFSITALAANITSMTSGLSGTPVHGDGLLIEITGTATRTISWGSSFEASTIALPTTTSSTAMLSVALVWNSTTSKWRCVGVA